MVDTIIYKGEDDSRAKILNTTYHTTWVGTIFDDYGLLNRAYVIDEYLYGQKDDITEDDRYLMGIAESMNYDTMHTLSLIHISEPTRREWLSRMPSSA